MPTAALVLSAATVTLMDDPAGRRFMPATVQARVTNIGQINDQFNVEVGGLPAAWSSRNVPGMRLRPGVDGTLDITVQPPRTPASTAGSRPITVRVTPQEQPSEGIEYDVTLIIPPFVDTSLDLVDPSQTTAGEARFQARLRNQGNVPLTYALAAQPGDADALTITMVTNQVTVSPGEERLVELRVVPTPDNGRDRPPGAYPFTVQATPVTPVAAWPELVPPPLTATGTLLVSPPSPVEVRVEPTRLELIDLVVREASSTVYLRNPSRHLIGVALEARAPSADYDVQVAQERLVLQPEAELAVRLTVQRSPLVPPTAAPLRQPFQVALRQVEVPATPDPSQPPAAMAAPGTIVFTPPPPVEVLIQPLGLKLDLAPSQQRGGRGHFRVVLTNQGAQPVPVTLAVSDLEQEVRYAFGLRPQRFTSTRQVGAATGQAGFTVTVEPQGRVEVPLEIRPAQRRGGGEPLTSPFTVRAAVNGQAVDSLTRQARFEYVPAARARVAALILLPLLLLALAGLVGLQIISRPPSPSPPPPPPPPTVGAAPPPIIRDLDPDALSVAATGAITRPLVITGANLIVPGTTVELTRPDQSRTALTPDRTASSATRLSVPITGIDLPVSGTYTVTVVNPGAGQVRSNPVPLRVTRAR